jgi:hypothetical protein
MVYRAIDNNLIPEIGKVYPYEYKGKLRVGECIENPDSPRGYKWAMRNLHTGKIEFPYCLQVYEPETKLYEIGVKTVEFELI